MENLMSFVEFRKPKPDNSKAIAQLEEEIERSKPKSSSQNGKMRWDMKEIMIWLLH
jgi:hypothetical protein